MPRPRLPRPRIAAAPLLALTCVVTAVTVVTAVSIAAALDTAQVRKLYGRQVYTISDKTLDDQYFIDLDNQVRAYFPGIDSLKIPYVVATSIKATSGLSGTVTVLSDLATQRKTTLGDSTGDTLIVTGAHSVIGASAPRVWANGGTLTSMVERSLDFGKYMSISEDTSSYGFIAYNYRQSTFAGGPVPRSIRAGGVPYISLYSGPTPSKFSVVQLSAGRTLTDTAQVGSITYLAVNGIGKSPTVNILTPGTADSCNGVLFTASAAISDTATYGFKYTVGSTDQWRVTADGTSWARGAYVGNWNSRTNYARIDTTGHLTWAGDGRPWRDVEMDALSIKTSASAKITENSTTVTMDYAADCTETSYLYGNMQLNHDRDPASPVWPHIHWLQAQSGTPNFFVAYRWHSLLRAYDSTWDTLNVTKLAKTYYTGTIHQLSYADSIPPPDSTNVSDILQFKIVRDRTNNTGRFAGSTDPTGNIIPVLSVDAHYMANSFGSDTQYTK